MHEVRLSDLVNDLLQKGYQPAAIRRQLAARGIRWEYGFARTQQGRRERERRMKQIGTYTEYLAEKWR